MILPRGKCHRSNSSLPAGQFTMGPPMGAWKHAAHVALGKRRDGARGGSERLVGVDLSVIVHATMRARKMRTLVRERKQAGSDLSKKGKAQEKIEKSLRSRLVKLARALLALWDGAIFVADGTRPAFKKCKAAAEKGSSPQPCDFEYAMRCLGSFKDVSVVTAAQEADSQLAQLERSGRTCATVSSDIDILVLGSKCLIHPSSVYGDEQSVLNQTSLRNAIKKFQRPNGKGSRPIDRTATKIFATLVGNGESEGGSNGSCISPHQPLWGRLL